MKLPPSAQLYAAEELLSRIGQRRSAVRRHSFLGYVCELLHHAKLYQLWSRLFTRFRRLRAVTLVLKAFGLLFTLLQAGTLALLGTIVLLFVLPLFAVLMSGALLIALLETGRTDRRLRTVIGERRVLVCFPTARQNLFLYRNALDFAERNWVVLAVSPHWLHPRGFEKRSFYCTAREESEGVYLVRPYYFFHLRRRILKRQTTAYWY